ncbi:MAG: MFS transporter [Bacteroidales bacterium]|nr:MFS transporter [Bacteroidales bacterium]
MNTQAKTSIFLLVALSSTHLFNDMLQAIISAVYPLIKSDLSISFAQIGAITLSYQISASIFQPIMGFLSDKRPNAYFLPLALIFTFCGLTTLAYADSFHAILISVSVVGIGSSILHPEAARLTSMASGGRRGLAQSIFQVGGNAGSALGPLIAALCIAPYGRENIALVALSAFAGIAIMIPICRWYRTNLHLLKHNKSAISTRIPHPLNRRQTIITITILMLLIFSKYLYMASINSYYTFYLIDKFGVSIPTSQIMLFIFVAATAVGTIIGGPIGDRFGRKYVIWASILGCAPFTLMLPHASLVGSGVLTFVIGLTLSSAFPAIIVYAQELLPNHLGLVSGLFYGFAFGIAGMSSAVLGYFADSCSVETIYQFCAYIPLLGIVAYFLPNLKKPF